ncbi:dTDP-4-dehydrorhamnose reductase [Ferruginibacter sp.]
MGSNKTILVTGANGQLGRELRVLAASFSQYSFLFVSKEELAIDDEVAVNTFFDSHTIDYCVNCAAYTAVDKAETEKEKAFLINATAVGNLASICRQHNVQLIHISTDYVFDGAAQKPYTETAAVKPLNVYGQSKLKGEELALQQNPSVIIIRTSWVYSAFGSNFVKTMLRLMKEKESIGVVNDQFGCPTYAADLALAILKIIQKHGEFHIPYPLFHYCNEGLISWYQFAAAIKEFTSSNCMVRSIPTTEYPTPAKRPLYTAMDTARIKEVFALSIPNWKESLQKCLASIQ